MGDNMRTINTEIKEEPKRKENSLRPQFLCDYIGQAKIKESLSIAISAAKIRKKPIGHILLYGPPGLGKTTLANIVANEMECRLKTVCGPSIEKQGDLAAVLSSLQPNDILFIDEIHRLPKYVEEILYSAMEDYKIDIMIGSGEQSKSITLDIAPFTLIGATTKAGMVSAPLRDRFHLTYNLEYYNEDELTQIIERIAVQNGYVFEREESAIIAKICRQTPRIAINLTNQIINYLLVKNKPADKTAIQEAINIIGYDEKGLNDADRKYIELLQKAGDRPVGLKTISSYLGETVDTITEKIEPFLLRQGYISITSRGRIISK